MSDYLFCYLDVQILIAFATAFMWFKIFIQNVVGAGTGRHVAAEDKNVPGAEVPEVTDGGNQMADEAFTKKMRVYNINNNDKENVPYTLFLFWGLYVIITNDGSGALGGDYAARQCGDVLFVCALIWIIARFFHAMFYLFGIQKPLPFRSISWAIGQLSALAVAVTMVIAAFQARFSDAGCDYCDAY